jgi:hypothetical protein
LSIREHGTRARYVHGPDERDNPKWFTGKGCRCDSCTVANNTYRQHNDRQRLDGRSPWVTEERAAAVRAHLTALREQGIGLRVIEQRSGVSRSALREAVQGGRMRHDTADRLLALSLDTPLPDGAYIAASNTWLQVNALLRAGYTKVWIAEQIGQSRALQLRKTQVTVRHARLIDTIYDRFVGLPPPLKGTRHCCASTGGVCTWPPTSSWFCAECGYALHECPPSLGDDVRDTL